MTYPFAPKKRTLAPWQRQFIGCCVEREWYGAASLLKRHAAEKPDAIGLGEFPDAVLLFVREAPEGALADSGLPFPLLDYESRRTALHEKLVEAHVTRTLFHVSKTQYGAAYHSLSAGLCLQPRNLRQEALITSSLEEIAAKIAGAEQPHALARADIEEDPSTLAPHPNDVAIQMAQLHPLFFPGLATQALAAGMSDGAIVSILEIIYTRLHWPSWRAFALLSNPAQAELRELASRVTSSRARVGSLVGKVLPSTNACRWAPAPGPRLRDSSVDF